MQSKYHRLVEQGANTLSATWSTHLPPNATTLPKLTHIEWNILKDTQTFPDHVTLEMLRTVNPYLPEYNARLALYALVEKGLLNTIDTQCYFFSERTRCFIRDLESALQCAAQSVQTLNLEQSDYLLSMTRRLIDQLGRDTNCIPSPIFTLAVNAITPSEHPLPQLQQRLFALQAYFEDAFIAAWKSESYMPNSVQLAQYMMTCPEGVALQSFLNAPIFCDEKQVRGGLGILIERGDAIDTGVGYALTARGVFRYQRVVTLAENYFVWAFDNYLSKSEQHEWLKHMTALVGNQAN